jgi:hypothetical protein
VTNIPFIPETAPFSAEQRAWLNGFLAGLFANGIASQTVSLPSSKPAEPLLVLFGSQTGTAEALAQKFAAQARQHGFAPQVLPLNDFQKVNLTAGGKAHRGDTRNLATVAKREIVHDRDVNSIAIGCAGGVGLDLRVIHYEASAADDDPATAVTAGVQLRAILQKDLTLLRKGGAELGGTHRRWVDGGLPGGADADEVDLPASRLRGTAVERDVATHERDGFVVLEFASLDRDRTGTGPKKSKRADCCRSQARIVRAKRRDESRSIGEFEVTGRGGGERAAARRILANSPGPDPLYLFSLRCQQRPNAGNAQVGRDMPGL